MRNHSSLNHLPVFFRIFLLALCLFPFSLFAQQNSIPIEREAAYGDADDPNLPEWVRAMYADDPNVPQVVALYEAYYKTHSFEKNSHTQYFKRWVRASKPYVNEEGFIRPPSIEAFDARFAELMALKAEQNSQQQQRGPNTWGTANWKGIGPFDFDKDAGGRSHAPGAAHVYTLEKAPSNPDILYCGTATAGVWKTTDRGLNWTCLTLNLPITYSNALEIHPTDANTVFCAGNGRLYKSTDGGLNWAVAGDAAFSSLSQDIREIAYKPGDPNILYIGSDKGFFRSTDGGANFTKILPIKTDAYFSEIEFKTNDNNTMYVLLSEVFNRYTELYKSTDGGLTFSLLPGWPVLSSANTYTYQHIQRPSSGTNYAAFSNDHLGTSSFPDFTIEIRVKFPANTIYDKAILSNKNWSSGANKGWVIAARYTGQLTFNMGDGSSNRIDLHTDGIWDDSWHMVSVVYRTNGSKELYVDGTLAASVNNNYNNNVQTTLPMILGYDGNLAYGGHEMSVDEIRIFNTPLSAATIAAWSLDEMGGAHPNSANVLHHYKCNEANGNTLIDEKGTNNGTITGTINRLSGQYYHSTTLLASGEHQRRAEIATTAADPDRIYALLAGVANGGQGLYGVYMSNDNGNTWTHKCCGSGPGGPAVATPTVGITTPGSNANILGYSETGGEEGGQYYYDLAIDADPGNANKVHIGGINHWYSVDGGTTFNLTAKWSWPDDARYVHADIHNIAIYDNEVWVACDGGVFMSPDSGKLTFAQRQYGIQGTDFWGFGMGHKDGDVMLGGTYHNSHLLKNNNVYINGWTSYTGSADGTRGFVNPGKPKTVYNDSGKDQLPAVRTGSPVRTTFSKLPNTGENPSKIIFDPRCYNCLYTGNGNDLWYSDDDGDNFTLVYTFPGSVGDIEICWSDAKIMYVSTSTGFYDPKKLWKSTDGGVSWTDITPASATLGFATDMSFDVAVGDNNSDLWLACFHPYGWNSSNNNKVYYSADGGATWANWSTAITNGQGINNIVYQRGSNGGVYLGTRQTVLYRNKALSDWVIYNDCMPASMSSQNIFPWYKEGKIRNAGSRSVWESRMYNLGTPVAQPMADLRKSYCSRDTVYFADFSAHYKTDAGWLWQITPAPAWISSNSVENPKVVFGASGLYSISLSVTDSMGSSTRLLQEGIEVDSQCEPDTVTGNTMKIELTGQYAATTRPLNLNTNTMTVMAWVKPSMVHTQTTGVLFWRGGTTTTGIHLENTNRLAYHWNDQYYGFNSGLTLPTNEWSHIALVVEPTKATLYLNGRPAANVATHVVEAFDAAFNMGRDPSTSSRTFRGNIDEVCVYRRALTQTEIREQMHFVKVPNTEPDLVSYYQFNEISGTQVPDRAGIYHAKMIGASRVLSTAPFATGVVNRTTVSTGGPVTFGNTGLTINFPASGNKPNGELVVSRLYREPDELPAGVVNNCDNYWIVNNYGSNSTFAPLVDLTFENIGSTVANDQIALHKRRTGQDGPTWGSPVATFTTTVASPSTDVTFPGSGITSFSQFNISAQSSPLPVEWLRFTATAQQGPKRVQLQWQTAQERNSLRFEVERSKDLSRFEKIGELPAAGYSNVVSAYQLLDEQPLPGKSYYRIRQVDGDGKSTYSPIAAVAFQSLHEAFTIMPTLLRSGEPVLIRTETSGFTASTTDAHGRLLFEQQLNTGDNIISTENLPTGVYMIRIFNGREAIVKKIIVE
ncbi:MAG: T9SS type A sorting domain-containing protein [Chitinophagales bacterium]|nr:T9SS type A sorting domain-containing protein [Chitinophagales bacterium]